MLRAGSLLGYFCFLIIWAVMITGAARSDAPLRQSAHMARWYMGEVLVCFALVSAVVATISVVVADNKGARHVTKIVDGLLIGSTAFMLYVIVDVAWIAG